MKTSRSLIEQEVTITYNRDEEHALVGTCVASVINKLTKRNVEIHRKDGEWITYKVPKTWIKISPPKFVSEERRHQMSVLMKARKIVSFAKKSDSTLGKTT